MNMRLILWLIRINNSMEKFSQIFKNIPEIEPPAGLAAAILSRIETERNQKLRRQLTLSLAGSLSSVLAAVWAIAVFGGSVLNSEFISMASLIFSDINIVARNWNDFALSLLETLPTLSVIVILVPLFTLFLSLSSYLNLHSHRKFI